MFTDGGQLIHVIKPGDDKRMHKAARGDEVRFVHAFVIPHGDEVRTLLLRLAAAIPEAGQRHVQISRQRCPGAAPASPPAAA